MNGKNKFDDMLSQQDSYLVSDDFYLTDDNFNDEVLDEVLFDNRVWKSSIEDISGGDNFADYCKYIFRILEEEEYFDN